MKMGHYTTEAVVLNSFNFAESDAIIAFCTLDYGKLRAVAKGLRRSRKRFVGKLDPPALIRLMFFHNGRAELQRVEDAVLIDGLVNLKSDITRLAHASYLLELSSEFTREGQDTSGIYGLLSAFLKMMDSGIEPVSLCRFFDIKLLSALGYLPHLGSCVSCGKGLEGASTGPFFSSSKGGMLCKGCSKALSGLVPVSIGSARVLSAAERFDAKKITRLKADKAFLKESDAALSDFITHILGKGLKTRGFLEKLKCPA